MKRGGIAEAARLHNHVLLCLQKQPPSSGVTRASFITRNDATTESVRGCFGASIAYFQRFMSAEHPTHQCRRALKL